MNPTLVVVVVPVSDLDRAKTFYAEKLASAWTMTPGSATSTSG